MWWKLIYGRVVPTWTKAGRAQLAWQRMHWKLIKDEMHDFWVIDADEPTVDLRLLPTVRLTAAPDMNAVAVLRLLIATGPHGTVETCCCLCGKL